MSELEAELNETFKLVKNGWNILNSKTDAVFLLVATDRALDAKEKLEEAGKIWDTDKVRSLKLLAYVKWRIYTVKLWYSMTEVREETRLKLGEVKELAASYLAKARSTWSYVGTLLEEMGTRGDILNEAFKAYQLSKDSFMEGDYIATCIRAIKSLSYSEASMASAIAEITLKPDYLVQYSRRIALMNIASASRTVEPIISILYLKNGDLEKDVNSKVLLYKLSSYYAKLIRDLASLLIPEQL